MQSVIQHRRLCASIDSILAPNAQDPEKQSTRSLAQNYDLLGVRQSQDSKNELKTETDTKTARLLVDFNRPHDPHNPAQWSPFRKWTTTIAVGFTGLLVGWSSSIDSAVIPQAKAEFGVSTVTESLATGLYLIGFGFGALVSGPLSETLGRNPVYLATLALFAAWILGSALAPNIGAQLVFRTLAGFCGATPLTTFGGSTADMWNPLERTFVFPIMACMSFLGPFLAPMVGAFIGQSDLISWRWTEWVTLIMTGLVVFGIAAFAPETYAPIILDWKAAYVRELTGDDRYVAVTSIDRPAFATRLETSILRPFQLFFQEPIIVAFTLYLSVIYVVLFTFLTGYDFIFGPEGIYGLSQGSEGLCFIGLNVGFLFAMALCPWIYVKYRRSVREAEQAQSNVQPEQRLWYAMIAAPFCPISLFWMGWTAQPSISFWSSIVASVAFGFSMMGVFITSYQYLIDAYEKYAASALVSLTLFRYLAAGAMVVVSNPMYENLGVHWTLTLLGCIAVLLTPIPYVLYVYGPTIRKTSKFSR